MKRAYAAILFDLDGTLFDLRGCERQTVARLLGQILPQLGREQVEAFLDVYAQESPGHWARGLAAGSTREEIVEGIFAAVLSHTGIAHTGPSPAPLYWRIFAGVSVLAADAQPCLERLAAQYRLGVVTNGYADTQRPRLAASGLIDFFDAVAVSGELDWAKPDARIFHHALARLGVAAADALYVGDSVSHDLAGAANAGMDFVLYRPDSNSGESLPPGTRTVPSFSRLASLLT